MAFASHVNFKYHCLSVDKKFIDSASQIVEHLRASLIAFIDSRREDFSSIHLIELRLANGISMTPSEMRFFGGPRDFKRNVLRKIKVKEI